MVSTFSAGSPEPAAPNRFSLRGLRAIARSGTGFAFSTRANNFEEVPMENA
jgi:hypothetical protein